MKQFLMNAFNSSMSIDDKEVLANLIIHLSAIIIIMILFCLGSMLFLFIYDKQYDAFWKIKNKKRPLIYKKINIMLYDICGILGVPVFVKSDEWFEKNRSDACGYISHINSNLGIEKATIYLRKDKHFDTLGWTTFAHEIGHYISIDIYGDNSEEGADYEAKKLIKSLLDSEEKVLLKDDINIFFSTKGPIPHSHPMEVESHHKDPSSISNNLYITKMNIIDYCIRHAKAVANDNEEIQKEYKAIKFPFYIRNIYNKEIKKYKEED